MRDPSEIIMEIHKRKPNSTMVLGSQNFAALEKWLEKQNRVFRRDGDALIIAGRRIVERA
jgi:hypothetical protein